MDKDVKIEIGENLLEAIKVIVDATEKVNACGGVKLLHPGEEVKKALGIDLVKMHANELLELRKRLCS